MLEGLQSKSQERTWLRNQGIGELDDAKLGKGKEAAMCGHVAWLVASTRDRDIPGWLRWLLAFNVYDGKTCTTVSCLPEASACIMCLLSSHPPSRSFCSVVDVPAGLPVDGMAGERLVFRRRGEPIDQPLGPKPGRRKLLFVADVSGSMYRFNGE